MKLNKNIERLTPRLKEKSRAKESFLIRQRRIAKIQSAADRKLALPSRRKEKMERVKKGLMNELLTGGRG